jgi:hypothetical protein
MLASDHLLSELASLARRREASPAAAAAAVESAELSFKRAVVPVVGTTVAEELFAWWRDEAAAGPSGFERLGYIAAFLLGEYEQASMPLPADAWSQVREALSAEAESLDLDVLTKLMGELVSRGVLD